MAQISIDVRKMKATYSDDMIVEDVLFAAMRLLKDCAEYFPPHLQSEVGEVVSAVDRIRCVDGAKFVFVPPDTKRTLS